MIRIALIGGSGVWSDQAYCHDILELIAQGVPLKLSLICDPVNPRSIKDRPNLQELVALMDPVYFYEEEKRIRFEHLTRLQNELQFSVVIISCDPIYHFEYCEWAASLNLKVICDKPVVLEPDSASSVEAARSILTKYHHLESLFSKYPDHFFVPLGYRNRGPYVDIAKCVRDVY